MLGLAQMICRPPPGGGQLFGPFHEDGDRSRIDQGGVGEVDGDRPFPVGHGPDHHLLQVSGRAEVGVSGEDYEGPVGVWLRLDRVWQRRGSLSGKARNSAVCLTRALLKARRPFDEWTRHVRPSRGTVERPPQPSAACAAFACSRGGARCASGWRNSRLTIPPVPLLTIEVPPVDVPSLRLPSLQLPLDLRSRRATYPDSPDPDLTAPSQAGRRPRAARQAGPHRNTAPSLGDATAARARSGTRVITRPASGRGGFRRERLGNLRVGVKPNAFPQGRCDRPARRRAGLLPIASATSSETCPGSCTVTIGVLAMLGL